MTLSTCSGSRPTVCPSSIPESRCTSRRRGPRRKARSGPSSVSVNARSCCSSGEIAERKNVRLLVEAFARAVSTVPDARLVLVGSPGLGSLEVNEAIDRLGIADAVIRLGHAQQAVVEALVATADVLVLPSVDEGFGFPALEAMSVGTPVIASASGSLPEVVGDAGLLVPVNEIEPLTDAIVRVLADAQLRAELGQRGRRRATGYSWRAAAEKTIQVYGHAFG